jgi:2-hydroxy-6-oxonona-2,4-dienedioate hydrolase
MDAARYLAAEHAYWAAVGVRPTSRRVHLERLGVDVRVQEVGEGPPVLFVHGGPNSGSTWGPLVAHLPGLRCLLLDRPGTGLSDPLPTPLALAAAPAAAEITVGDVLDGLGIDEAHVVASSFGGYVALHSAAREPDRVGRMVQMACPALAPGMLTPPFMRALGLAPVRWLLGVLPPSPRAAPSILRQIGHGASLDADRIPRAFLDWYLALQRHTDTFEHETAMIGSGVSPLRGFDAALTIDEDLLRRVETPVRFLWGADDGFGGEDVARRLVDLLPHAELEMLPGAGHLPWLDAPEHVAGRTAGFLLDADEVDTGRPEDVGAGAP